MTKITSIYDESQLRQDMLWVVRAFNNENDLTFCVVSVSYLEACLKDFLLSKLKKSSVSKQILSHKGALGSAFSKAQLAYSLGFISKEYFQDIQLLLDVRNLFAHVHTQCSFETSEIARKCQELKLSTMLPPEKVDESVRESYEQILKSPKVRFSMANTTICNHLLSTNA